MSIDTVFFDVGNTLIWYAHEESNTLVEVTKSLGIDIDPQVARDSVVKMYEYYETMFGCDNSVWGDEERAKGVWIALYEHFCDIVGIKEHSSEIAQRANRQVLQPQNWDFFDDVKQTLDALKAKNIRMAVISNWDSSLKNILEGMGATSYFDTIICSAAVGMYKPQAEIFELAISRMNTQASRCMHVGDHILADVAGSANVGIKPVLLDRKNIHANSDDYVRVTKLTQLWSCFSPALL